LVQFVLHGLQYKYKENEQVCLSDRNVDIDAMLRETNSIQDGRRIELL